jgi:hypothetical protein
MRADGHKVSCSQGTLGPFGKVRLRDFFNDGLTH